MMRISHHQKWLEFFGATGKLFTFESPIDSVGLYSQEYQTTIFGYMTHVGKS